jgi:hypothetical protein
MGMEHVTCINQPLTPTHEALAKQSDWVEEQCTQEFFAADWQKFASKLGQTKRVQVVSNGGAKPNPGTAGRSARIQKNGAFTWNDVHSHRASNNAMELRAVVEA